MNDCINSLPNKNVSREFLGGHGWTPIQLSQILKTILRTIYERPEDTPDFCIVLPKEKNNEYLTLHIDKDFPDRRDFSKSSELTAESILDCYKDTDYFKQNTNCVEIRVPNHLTQGFIFLRHPLLSYPLFFQHIVKAFEDSLTKGNMEKKTDFISHVIQSAALSILTENGYNESDAQIFTELSALEYERETAAGCIVILESGDSTDDILIKLSNDYSFSFSNCRQLRKLLEISDVECPMIIQGKREEYPSDEDFTTIIIREKCVYGYNTVDQCKARIVFDGHLSWNLQCSSNVILLYRNGGYKVPIAKRADSKYSEKCVELFGVDKCNKEQLEELFEELITQDKGTSILVTDVAQNTAQRLAKAGRGFLIDPIDLHKVMNKIRRLSSIDGCLIVDPMGCCFGLGMILDGEAVAQGNPARGARFNSLMNYVKWRKSKCETEKNFVLIVSEDKMIDCFSTDDFM